MTITRLQDWLVFKPSDLSEAKWGSMDNVLRNEGRRRLSLKLWLAATAKEPLASDMRRRELAITQLNPQRAFEIADMIAGAPVDDAQMGEASKEAARDVGFEDDKAIKGGARSIVAKIAARVEYLRRIQRFESLGGGAVVIRSCELRSKSVASGIR